MTTTLARPRPTAPRRPAKLRRRRRAVPPRPPLRGRRLLVASVASTLLGLTAWLLVFSMGLSGFHERHTQHVLYSHLRERLALATVPIGGVISPGTPIAVMTVPAMRLKNVVVVEGTTSSDLQAGPGHYPGSVLPGQAGVAVIFGKSVMYGRPFASLGSLRAGDVIEVTTGQGAFRYSVTGLRRPGDLLPPALAAGGSRLTLGTAQQSGWRSGWAPTDALYVDATLQGKVQPTPAGHSTAVRAADLPFHSDTAHLVPLVLWLQLDVIAAAVLMLALFRWRLTSVWLVGAPVLLALVWGTTSAAAPLLPNVV